MLEDALQATLPKPIHGVRVADIGQGSEPMRILGIRWLDAGEAAEEKDGMKAEEGDFVNLEVAVSYRSRSTKGSGLRDRSGNAHLLTEFLVAGGMVLPVWVELTGMLATARIRIQLTPNPPFFSLLTLTLLGQPKTTMICTPLAKNFLNVMDIPGLSGWLQRSVDAAIAEYVAPMSLNMDLKTILMGREKMDTDAMGVIIITIRSAKDFKEGDAGILFTSRNGKKGDGYVTAGWSKWGKPLWSTRSVFVAVG
jgi:Ca2+-dependent lipid-binding protein